MSEALVVVTAVAPESRAVLRALRQPTRVRLHGFRAWRGTVDSRPVIVMQSGIGPERARRALTALSDPCALVVSAGFAGALVGEVGAGDVVLPETIVWRSGAMLARYAIPTGPWQSARAALPTRLASRTVYGPLLSSPTVLASVADKRDAARRFRAVAVEMEVAGLLEVARQRNVGVLALRTILDAADVSLEGLPANLDTSWAARARLIGMPHVWSRVAALARQVSVASGALADATDAVLRAL